MAQSPGEAQWQLTYQISPIFMTGGLAGSMPGATVPLISYTEGNLFGSLLDAGVDRPLDSFFAQFMPVAGSLLGNYAVGKYPFANQQVAANAIIFEPLRVSMVMICPMRRAGDPSQHQAVITSLVRTLNAHILAGGTFSVATPKFLYIDCLLTGFSDASGGETKQPQYRYQLDFEKPLISQQEAQQSYNNLMAKIGAQTQLTPNANGEIAWSGVNNTVDNAGSGAATNIIPSTRSDPGLGFAPSVVDRKDAGSPGSGFAGTLDRDRASVTPTSQPTSPSPAGTAILNASEMNIPTVVY